MIDGTDAAPGAVQHTITTFGPIDAQDTGLRLVLMWELSRMGADAADTYGAMARLMEFDIHFWQDSIGSGQEYSK